MVASKPHSALDICPHWTSLASCWPLVPSCLGPSGWDPWPASTFTFGAICNLGTGCEWHGSSSSSLTKMKNRTVLSAAQWYPPYYQPPGRAGLTDHYLGPDQFFNCSSLDTTLWETVLKALVKSSWMTFTALLHPQNYSFDQKQSSLVRHGVSSVKKNQQKAGQSHYKMPY